MLFFNDSTTRLFFWPSRARLRQYTVFFLPVFLRWGFLIIAWILAISGLIAKTIYFTTIPEWLGLSFYLGLGWMGLYMGFKLWQRYGFTFIRPLVIGGICYAIGAIIGPA